MWFLFTSIGEAHQANFSSLREKVEEKMVLARNARHIYIPQYVWRCGCGSGVAACGVPRRGCPHRRSVSELPACNEALRVDAQEVKSLCRELGYGVPRLSLGDAAMRMEVKEGIGGSTVIVDTYNSDINSLALALDTLRDAAGCGGVDSRDIR